MEGIQRLLSESEGSDEGNLWVLGAILVLIGTVGQNLGNNIVSVAHGHSQHDDDELIDEMKPITEVEEGDKNKEETSSDGGEKKEPTWVQKHLWAVGTAIFVSGSLCNFVSFGYAAQSLLASLQSVQFLSNMLFAKIVHHEELTWTMIGATFTIVCGNVLVVLFSEHTAVKYTGEEIFNLWATNSVFHAYLGIMGSTAIICEYIYRKYNYSRMVEGKLLQYHSFLEPACYCLASAFVGTLAIMNAKCLSMYLTGGDAGSEFASPPLYVALFIWLSFVTFWFRRMDHGLDLFPPLFFIPVLMISFVFVNIIAGGIFFQEFAAFDGTQYAGFCCGAGMILSGVYFLAPPNTMEVGPQEAEEVGGVLVGEGNRSRTHSTSSVGSPDRAKRSRRLSFSSIDSDGDSTVLSDTTASARITGRPRVNTMSHPLAALKETRRRASQLPAYVAAESYVTGTVAIVEEGTTRSIHRVSVAVGLVEGEDAAKNVATELAQEETQDNVELSLPTSNTSSV